MPLVSRRESRTAARRSPRCWSTVEHEGDSARPASTARRLGAHAQETITRKSRIRKQGASNWKRFSVGSVKGEAPGAREEWNDTGCVSHPAGGRLPATILRYSF